MFLFCHWNLSQALTKDCKQQVQLHQSHAVLAHHLSAGLKRRLALARLLASPKPLWILDEPLTHLDPNSQQWLSEQLEYHLQHGGISIIASHQLLRIKNLQVLCLEGGTLTHV